MFASQTSWNISEDNNRQWKEKARENIERAATPQLLCSSDTSSGSGLIQKCNLAIP